MWHADRLPALAPGAPGGHAGCGPGRTRSGEGSATPAGGAALERPARDAAAPDLALSPAPWALSPRLAACCNIVMGVTMGYMLILSL